MASLNVRCVLTYQDAPRGMEPGSKSDVAHTVIKEKKNRTAGVGGRMARSDPWRWVSTPRWARHSAKVTSTCQRRTNQARISPGSSSGSRLKKACGSRSPVGSRTRTQRSGTGGEPLRYQTATSEARATVRVWLPYQPVSVTVRQAVAASASRCLSLGRWRPYHRPASPFSGPAWRDGGEQVGIQAQAADHGAGLPPRREQVEHSEAAVADEHQPVPGQPAAHAQNALAGPVGERLVAPAAFGMVALGRRQDAEERQGPDPARPGDRGEHQEAEPAQAAGLDEVAMAGARTGSR